MYWKLTTFNTIPIMKKQHYETPTTETLVVRFEGALLNGGSPNLVYGARGAAGADATYNGYDEDF